MIEQIHGEIIRSIVTTVGRVKRTRRSKLIYVSVLMSVLIKDDECRIIFYLGANP